MMTCIGGQWDTLGMYEVVVHEIAHMWHPMQVGSDEKHFAWMDEGFAQYDQSQAMADFFKGYDDEAENREPYVSLAQDNDLLLQGRLLQVDPLGASAPFPCQGLFDVVSTTELTAGTSQMAGLLTVIQSSS